MRRKINAFLLTLSYLQIILINYDVSEQFTSERRVVLWEPVSSGVLMNILMGNNSFLIYNIKSTKCFLITMFCFNLQLSLIYLGINSKTDRYRARLNQANSKGYRSPKTQLFGTYRISQRCWQAVLSVSVQF